MGIGDESSELSKGRTIMKPTAFLTNAAFAEEFFLRCMERKADTIEEREQIMEDLVKELKAIRMTDTDLHRYLKNKRVLHVKRPNG